jgi:hypothetical protein
MVWQGFVSAEAAKKIPNRKEVVKEHIVPLRVITKILLDRSKRRDFSLQAIADTLDEYVIFGTISKREDQLLREAKLTSKMPVGFWEAGHALFEDKFARYTAVGITCFTDDGIFQPIQFGCDGIQ